MPFVASVSSGEYACARRKRMLRRDGAWPTFKDGDCGEVGEDDASAQVKHSDIARGERVRWRGCAG